MGAFNIPLMVDHPQFETPVEAQKQVLGLKQMAGVVAGQNQDRQLGELRMQDDALKIKAEEEKQAQQQADRDEEDEVNKLGRDASWDLDKVAASAAANPKIRGPKVLELQQAALARKKQIQSVSDQDVDRQIKNHEVFGEDIRSIREAPPDKRPGLLAGVLARNVAEKRITPEEAQQYSQLNVNDDNLLEHVELGMRSTTAMLESDKKRREAEAAAVTKAQESRQVARVNAYQDFSEVTDQDSYTEWRNSLPKEIQREYPMRIDQKQPDGTTVAQLVARKARTLKEQDARDEKLADKTTSEVELAIQANDPSAPPEKRKAAKDALADLAKQKAAGSGGLSDAQQRLRENDKQKRIQDAQEGVDKMQVTKDKLAADAEGIGLQIKALNVAMNDKADPLSPAKQAEAGETIARLTKELKSKQDEFASTHTRQEKANKAKEQLQKDLYPPAEVKPQKGTEKYLPTGEKYVFDGSQYKLEAAPKAK